MEMQSRLAQGVVWFSSNTQYDHFIAIFSANAGENPSYSSWKKATNSQITYLKKRGVQVIKVKPDMQGFLQWYCAHRTASAEEIRTQFILHLR